MNTPNVSLPPGFDMVETSPGVYQVVPTGERLTRTVAFRVPPSEYMGLLPFFEAFPGSRGSVALRWLINQPEVQAIMRTRVEAGEVRASAS